MKTKILLFSVAAFISYGTWAQTSFGGYTYPLPNNTAGTGGNIGNSYFGNNAGNISSGSWNTFIGGNSGENNTIGFSNTFLGLSSGMQNEEGFFNTYVGAGSGQFNNNDGERNTYIGASSGRNSTGSDNVFLGYEAGHDETNSHRLYIDNSDTDTPLIWGDFSTDALRFNGSVRIRFSDIISNNGLNNVLVVDGLGNIHRRTAASLDDQNLSVISAGTNRTINISGGSGTGFSVADNDNNSTNEIQDLSLSGTTLSLTGDGTTVNLNTTFATDAELAAHVDADADPNNELQTLDYEPNLHILSISEGDSENIAPFPSYPASAGDGGGNTNAYYGHETGVNSTGINNTFVGHRSGFNNTGNDNSSLGSQTLENNISGERNTANGVFTLFGNTEGNENTAVGYAALGFNSTGNWNTATGAQALLNNGVGNSYNTATGYQALMTNTGNNNTATGTQALTNNSGNNNTATGTQALTNNSGNDNTANGYGALENNDSGSDNTVVGYQALQGVAATPNTGNSNTVVGYQAMHLNVAGAGNVAVGRDASSNNVNGHNNTAIGISALNYNETGSQNVAIGFNSGPTAGITNLNNTIAIGASATIGVSNTIAIGNLASATWNNSIAIGNFASTTAANQFMIGNAFITDITAAAEIQTVSDGRFKKVIEEDVPGLEFIEKLRPVSYELDRNKLHTFLTGETPQEVNSSSLDDRHNGFIAQEVESIVEENNYAFFGVKKPTNKGDNYGISYSTFVVPLVKGMQEQQELIETMQEMMEAQQQEIETLKTMVYGTGNTNSSTQTEGLKQETTRSKGFSLAQNVPNPFDKTTTISATIPETVRQAKIAIYNLNGLELQSYDLNKRGKVTVEISGGVLPSGMYLYALISDGQIIDTKKMILKK